MTLERLLPPSVTARYVGNWLVRENVRLHGSGKSTMTNLRLSRKASELPFGHHDNANSHKALQHLQRLRLKVDYWSEAGGDVEYSARVLSDSLKLLAGFRVRKHMAQASNQADFRVRLLDPNLQILESINRAYALYKDEQTPPEAMDEHQSAVIRCLEDYGEGAAFGRYWGEQESPLVEATNRGEVVAMTIGLAIIRQASELFGGVEYVPCRAPATDAEASVIEYPFSGIERQG